MSEATSNGHIAHAALEAVCYQIRAVLDVIRDVGRGGLTEIKVDGGMTRSAHFMQLQADVLQLPLRVSESNSVAAVGAALMAGLGTGVWGSLDDLRGIARDAGTIMPDPEAAAALDRSYAEWLAAVSMLTAQYGRHA
jgi:glycerol kinase